MNKIIFTNIIISIVIVMSISVFFTHTVVLADTDIISKTIIKYETIKIAEGDCLSIIAERNNTSSMSNKEFTKYLKEFNNLKSDTIYHGNNIIVPIFE